MTFKILSDKSSKIIHCSNVQPTDNLFEKNICLESLVIPEVVKYKHDMYNEETPETSSLFTLNIESSYKSPSIPIIDPLDLVRRMLLCQIVIIMDKIFD